MMKAIISLFVSLLLVTSAGALPPEPMQPDAAFALEAYGTDKGVTLTWTIAPGYYLYRDHFVVSVNGQNAAFGVSKGIRKSDPDFGDVEVLYDKAAVTVPSRDGIAKVTFQGCQDGGICYMPEVRSVDLSTPAVSKLEGSPLVVEELGSVSLAEAGIVLSEDSNGSSRILRDGSAFWITLSFLGFGLLLAFTPCVFPMYPIVLGMLGGAGERSSPGRAFVLSSTYVVSLAFAFGLAGAVVGWTGQNIQFALQSPVTTAAMALLFVVLAAGSFGAFELQLPGFVTSRASKPKANGGASVGRAAALGFTSSLVVGPCVTAPLAGALLYIGRGGDWRMGALALFALGLGKGLPLIILSTAGSKVLPKAGAWMGTVRRMFGFAFLGTSIWVAAPLLPGRFDLALYATLVFLVVADLARRIRFRLAKAAASSVLFAVAGGILGAGAGAFATSPADARISIASAEPAGTPLSFAAVGSTADLIKEIAAADGKPIMLYVTARWCVICRTIERSVLPDAEVVATLQGWKLVKLDVTDYGEEEKSVLRQLKAVGPPTIIFLDGSRREVADTRLVGSVSAADVARSARSAASQ